MLLLNVPLVPSSLIYLYQLNAFKMIMASNQKHPAASPLDPRGK